MDICEDFEILRTHLIAIRQNYNTYYDLFLSGHDKILEHTACSFFNDISEIMLRDWILQVCKIMDPAETRIRKEKVENITINLINQHLGNQGLLTPKIKKLTSSILKYGDKLLPARNKMLAHFDRATHNKEMVLGATSEIELDKFLLDIQNYSDEVGKAIGVGPLDFSGSGCFGDVTDLIKVLKNQYEDAMKSENKNSV